MARVDLDADAVQKAIREQLLTIAGGIADVARSRSAMHELRGDKWGPRAAVRGSAVVVTTSFPFAHLDEFGGPNVRSTPTGAMRSAAAEAGRFIPAAKP